VKAEMAAFVFQLEGVLRHRKNIERERQRELAGAAAQMQQLRSELQDLDGKMREAMVELRERGLIGRLDMSYLGAHRRFAAAMQQRAMVLAQRMALSQRQVDDRRKALAEAAKERKVMEKLRERHYERWLEDVKRREMQDLDEMGMQLSYRQARDEGMAVEEGGAGR